MTVFKRRPTCAGCGKKYGLRDTRTDRVTWPAGEPMPPYEGKGVITRADKPRGSLGTDKSTLYAYRTIWDGESWFAPYEPFCTLRCALRYARRAYNK